MLAKASGIRMQPGAEGAPGTCAPKTRQNCQPEQQRERRALRTQTFQSPRSGGAWVDTSATRSMALSKLPTGGIWL